METEVPLVVGPNMAHIWDACIRNPRVPKARSSGMEKHAFIITGMLSLLELSTPHVTATSRYQPTYEYGLCGKGWPPW